MGWVELAGAVFQLILKIFDAISESNKSLKAEKSEIIKEMTDAVIKKDTARISILFDRINRL